MRRPRVSDELEAGAGGAAAVRPRRSFGAGGAEGTLELVALESVVGDVAEIADALESGDDAPAECGDSDVSGEDHEDDIAPGAPPLARAALQDAKEERPSRGASAGVARDDDGGKVFENNLKHQVIGVVKTRLIFLFIS